MEKDYVLKKHNELRSKVAKGLEERGANGSGPQPKAADMSKLVWDPLLEKIAQRYLGQSFNFLYIFVHCLRKYQKCQFHFQDQIFK